MCVKIKLRRVSLFLSYIIQLITGCLFKEEREEKTQTEEILCRLCLHCLPIYTVCCLHCFLFTLFAHSLSNWKPGNRKNPPPRRV